ncbi:MAG: hypothetical protein RLZZ385_1317 [Pseudomonadota bacterium]|jgi:D-glycerate 3-kinase
MDAQLIHSFIQQERLPAAYGELVRTHFAPLLAWLTAELEQRGDSPLVLGINGAQGSGKTTLVRFLEMALPAAGIPALALSLDDFYLDRESRRQLAETIHPLLAIRGVPGTHDTRWLLDVLQELRSSTALENLSLPVFDKARDDRLAPEHWRRVSGRPRVVLLEGWCVGVPPQSDAELEEPLNRLEAEEDPQGIWRRYVNACLADDYHDVFRTLDRLLMLQVPDWDSVLRWRRLQEEKLARAAPDGTALMDAAQLARFMECFERLTRHSLATLPPLADVLLRLNDAHGIEDVVYRG